MKNRGVRGEKPEKKVCFIIADIGWPKSIDFLLKNIIFFPLAQSLALCIYSKE